MNKEEIKSVGQLCETRNIKQYKIIDPKSIVLGDWTRHKCQYGCPAYNTNLCCPPYSPDSESTKKIIDDYNIALLLHFGKEGKVSKNIVELERKIFLLNFPKTIGFGAGPCTLCKECNLNSCQNPKLARPSMEACGIDVYTTAKNNGFPIEVAKNKEYEQNYYGLVLIE